MSLTGGARGEESESIVSAIEDMDRLTEFLDKSLDVAEARANALRLNRVAVDLDDLLRVMIELYEPSMSEKGLRLNQLCSAGWLEISADTALLHRMIANLFDNELKHLPAIVHGENFSQRIRRFRAARHGRRRARVRIGEFLSQIFSSVA